MRGIVLVCLACAALLPMTVAEAELTASDAPCGKEAWNRFVPDLVAAQSAFVRGDPASMKALCNETSPRDSRHALRRCELAGCFSAR